MSSFTTWDKKKLIGELGLLVCYILIIFRFSSHLVKWNTIDILVTGILSKVPNWGRIIILGPEEPIGGVKIWQNVIFVLDHNIESIYTFDVVKNTSLKNFKSFENLKKEFKPGQKCEFRLCDQKPNFLYFRCDSTWVH